MFYFHHYLLKFCQGNKAFIKGQFALFSAKDGSFMLILFFDLEDKLPKSLENKHKLAISIVLNNQLKHWLFGRKKLRLVSDWSVTAVTGASQFASQLNKDNLNLF